VGGAKKPELFSLKVGENNVGFHGSWCGLGREKLPGKEIELCVIFLRLPCKGP
jgi:hypothetical protein